MASPSPSPPPSPPLPSLSALPSLETQESKFAPLLESVHAPALLDRLWRWRAQLQEHLNHVDASPPRAALELGALLDSTFADIVLPGFYAWAKGFGAATDLYMALEADEPRLGRLLERLAAVKKLDARPFAALLAWPLLQLKTYRPLFERLLAATPPEHADHAALSATIRRVQQLVDSLHADLARAVSFERAVACLRLFSPKEIERAHLTNPALRWTKQGACTKMSSKARAQDRELVLFNDVLLLGKRHSVRTAGWLENVSKHFSFLCIFIYA